MPSLYRFTYRVAYLISLPLKKIIKTERGFQLTDRMVEHLPLPYISIPWIYQGIWRELLLHPLHELVNIPHYVSCDLEGIIYQLIANQVNEEDNDSSQFVSEEDEASRQYDAYLRNIEAERQRQVDADWAFYILEQDRAYREAVEASWAEGEPDDAEWPDYEEEEEEPTYTQVWYTESPGGHNYWE